MYLLPLKRFGRRPWERSSVGLVPDGPLRLLFAALCQSFPSGWKGFERRAPQQRAEMTVRVRVVLPSGHQIRSRPTASGHRRAKVGTSLAVVVRGL